MKYKQNIRKRYLLYMMILKSSWNEFLEDNSIKLSASLAYFTIFSMAPMLIVIISLCGIFFGKQAVTGELFGQIRSYVGDDAAVQIQSMIGNADVIKDGLKATVIGLVTMLIGATGVFAEIQSSLNFMWGIKTKPKKGYVKYLIDRSISFVFVIGMGFILLLSLALNSIILSFSHKIKLHFPNFPFEFANSVNSVFVFFVMCILFIIIYKFLPDAIIGWKDAAIGSIFTSALFMLGKWAIGYYLGIISLGITYGAAASLVVILLWIYYSALIIYFGAEFTHMYAVHAGNGIRPKHNAIFVEHREIKIRQQQQHIND